MTEKEANVAGEKLLKKVIKVMPNARLIVHENIGWHYCVRNNYISVNKSQTGSYWCLIGDGEKVGVGLGCWDSYTESKDPLESIALALKGVQDYMSFMNGVVGTMRTELNFDLIPMVDA